MSRKGLVALLLVAAVAASAIVAGVHYRKPQHPVPECASTDGSVKSPSHPAEHGSGTNPTPIEMSAEELLLAKSGQQAFGHKITIKPPDPWYLSNSTAMPIQVTLENTSGAGIRLPGIWIPCFGGTLGLPPENCFVEAARDGMPIPCDRRPPSSAGYGSLGNSSTGYPLYLQDYGDFSKPSKYTVRLIVKCPMWKLSPGDKTETTLLASNQVEFEVRAKVGQPPPPRR